MSQANWREVPVGLDAHRWVTRVGCRSVLMVVHTVTSCQRLLDVARLLGPDLRIQVVFTLAPDVFGNGAADVLHGLGALVLCWEQATRLEFDLAVAAAYGSLHEVHAPVIVLPHGAGYNKVAPQRSGGGAEAPRLVYGLDPQRIVRDGSVVPAAIVLSHEADLALLGRQCPAALPAAVVAGDPCYDRLMVSRPQRAAYRRALGVTAEQTAIVVTSTWGPRSLFGRDAALLDRMLSELPIGEYRVVALLHPNVWFGHGPWQVRAWLADWTRRGMALLPPTADWRAALVAADLIVGDQGSAAVYGAAVAAPVLLAGFADDDVDPASAAAMLATVAPRLRADRRLPAQISHAMADYDARRYEHVAARITSEPGRFGQQMQRLMYDLLRLSNPATGGMPSPAELPYLVG
jgi:hypothetical protein